MTRNRAATVVLRYVFAMQRTSVFAMQRTSIGSTLSANGHGCGDSRSGGHREMAMAPAGTGIMKTMSLPVDCEQVWLMASVFGLDLVIWLHT